MSLIDELVADFEQMDADPITVSTDQNIIFNNQLTKKNLTVYSIAKLKGSSTYEEIMTKVRFYREHKRVNSINMQVISENDPEYSLIIEATNFIGLIDDEIDLIHDFIKKIYRKRFFELDQIVQFPIDYLRTVQELGNNLNQPKNNENLQTYLSSATILILNVSASASRGENLTDEELNSILEGCKMGLDLNEDKQMILSYVESRMNLIAPNLSMIVGSSTAVKLISMANNLKRLSEMPSCHILLLGSHKKQLQGFSTRTSMPHAGEIFFSKIVQDCPSDLRVQMARLVACKVALAARIDSFHESSKGEQGIILLNEIKRRLDKLQEPPPVKSVKPLPKPIESGKKTRGGRRARAMKVKYGSTELNKKHNRIMFGKISEDIDQNDLGFSLGSIQMSGSGTLRQIPIDPKSKPRISKTLQKELQRQKKIEGGSATVQHRNQIQGTASTVCFTPGEGFQIINPNLSTKNDNTNQKYFSN